MKHLDIFLNRIVQSAVQSPHAHFGLILSIRSSNEADTSVSDNRNCMISSGCSIRAVTKTPLRHCRNQIICIRWCVNTPEISQPILSASILSSFLSLRTFGSIHLTRSEMSLVSIFQQDSMEQEVTKTVNFSRECMKNKIHVIRYTSTL